MPGFTDLTLHHSNHASSVLKTLNLFKQSNHIFCDCTLVVDGEEFPIHKSVLAASSQYFRALFTTDMKEKGNSILTLHGFSAQTFKSLINYVYTGQVTLNQVSITPLYAAADMLQLEGLKDLCHDYLLNQICASNCIGIWKHAVTFSNRKLEHSSWQYMMAYFTDVKESQEFLCLNLVEVEFLLSSYQQRFHSKDDVCSALCKWLLHDNETRKQDLLSLAVSCGLIAVNFGREMSSYLLCETIVSRVTANQNSTVPLTSLVIAGGYCEGSEKTCEQYSERTKSWQVATWDLSGYKCFHWVGVIGLRLYAIAGNGLTRVNTVMSRITDEAAKQTQTDALDRGWELEATLPHDCSSMKFCVVKDCIYGCGEIAASTFGVCQYNPGNGSWVLITDLLSKPRVFFQLISHQGKLHIIGGMYTSNGTATSSFETYDPISGAWEENDSMAIERYNFGVGIVGHCLYVVGGFRTDEIMLSSVEMYSFKTKMWSPVSALPVPKASMACHGWGGKLYCLGGETATAASADALVLDPTSGEWTTMKPLNHPRIYPSSISLLN